MVIGITGNSWLNPKLEVKKAGAHGKGVFALEDIARGERLAIFGGSVIPIDEIKNLPKNVQAYAMQIEERLVLANTSSIPEKTDYFNHSCDPNSGFNGTIFLVAMKSIKRKEEATFDYAMTISKSVGSDLVFEMGCNCGSPNCRKLITEQDWKLPELRKRYEGYFSEYIQQKIISEKKRAINLAFTYYPSFRMNRYI